MAAEHQIRPDPGLDRHQGQLVQMRPFGIGEAGIGELGQRLAPPQPERFAQGGRRDRRLARLHQPASLRHQCFEADDIHIVGTDIEGVAGFGGDDRRRSEGAAQLADLSLQGVGRIRRLPVAPQLVDQPVGADRLPPLERQQGQQGPLLGAAPGVTVINDGTDLLRVSGTTVVGALPHQITGFAPYLQGQRRRGPVGATR